MLFSSAYLLACWCCLTMMGAPSLSPRSVAAFSSTIPMTQRPTSASVLLPQRTTGAAHSTGSRTVRALRQAKYEQGEMDESTRMDLVRSIQKVYYNSPSTSTSIVTLDDDDQDEYVIFDGTPPKLSTETGILKNLPLMRVGWTEVPGRANVLTVDEGHYTHMFETMLRGRREDDEDQTPLYFGHLYLPGGTEASRSGEKRFALKSWKEEVADKERFVTFERSVVVGCLMQITDYRRVDDGRLILHVQALERFVVDKVVREFPYAVANVQVLPDVEQLASSTRRTATTTAEVATARRAAAVRRALHHYHPYEFAKTTLSLPRDEDYLDGEELSERDLKLDTPHAAYNLEQDFVEDDHLSTDKLTALSRPASSSSSALSLEAELEYEGILQDISVSDKSDAAGLEKLVWLALATWTHSSGVTLPDELLCLVPPELEETLDDLVPDVTLDEDYPPLRRQARLSFAALAVLEQPGLETAVRQALLQIPSTTARLTAVLQQLQQFNRQFEGLVPARRRKKGFE